MPYAHPIEFAVASQAVPPLREAAQQLGGILYADERPGAKSLPFRGLLMTATDDLSLLQPLADVGLYVMARRLIKSGEPTVVGMFPLLHHEKLSHAQADAHWRDKHAPLALKHHAHMTHYTQLSVVHRFSGLEIDGIACCAFANETDLRERFYTTKESVQIIADDVMQFANVAASPRRLIASCTEF